MAGALRLDEDAETDYTLREGEGGCWITVDGISVHISRRAHGVNVSLYRRLEETDDPLDEAEANFE